MARSYSNMDDAAAAFAWMLPRLFPDSRGYEYASGIVPTEGGFGYSEPRTSKQRDEFRVTLPAAMQGLIHNHPANKRSSNIQDVGEDRINGRFTGADRETQRTLGVPSYISAGNEVFRYDPSTQRADAVLAQIPREEYFEYVRRTYGLPGALR